MLALTLVTLQLSKNLQNQSEPYSRQYLCLCSADKPGII